MNNTNTTFSSFLANAAKELHACISEGQRAGQAYMNLLYDVRPDLYRRITNSESDPFFDNGRLGNFFAFLDAHWDDD